MSLLSVRRSSLMGIIAVIVSVLAVPTGAVAATGTASISGTLDVPAGADSGFDNFSAWTVVASDVDEPTHVHTSDVTTDNTFSVTDLPAGRWILYATLNAEGAHLPRMYHGDTVRRTEATVVDVAAEASLDDIDITIFDGATTPQYLTMTSKPTVTGTRAVGSTVTADPGVWEADDYWGYGPRELAADEFSYQWYLYGWKLDGATSASFTLPWWAVVLPVSVRVAPDLGQDTVRFTGASSAQSDRLYACAPMGRTGPRCA